MENQLEDENAFNHLHTALGAIPGCGEELDGLCRLLIYAMERETLSFREVKYIIEDEAEEVLLLAFEWRLLLPLSTRKSSSWEDRLLLMREGELYEIPNIIRCLLQESLNTGTWKAENAVYRFFKESAHPYFESMPGLVRSIFEKAVNHRITAGTIKMICAGFGLSGVVDSLIADLKAAGIMSPKLGSMSEVIREGSPIYELNPAIGIGLLQDGN